MTLAFGRSVSTQSQSTMGTPEKTNEPEPASQGWHVDVAPYLWFPGINGTVGALDHDASVHVSARKVLSYFNFGLMGAVEARYNRIIIPVDFMWVRLKDSKGIPITDDAGSVNVKINEYIFTPKVGYRIVDNSRFKTDALFGLRYWHVGTTLTLQPTQISNGFYGAANWVDAVAGGRFQAFLTPKVILTIGGQLRELTREELQSFQSRKLSGGLSSETVHHFKSKHLKPAAKRLGLPGVTWHLARPRIFLQP
jgi:hypothetical protein